jgi:hypothetical protein
MGLSPKKRRIGDILLQNPLKIKGFGQQPLHGYRHSYQFGVVEDGDGGRRGRDEVVGCGVLSRREAAHLILALLFKVGVWWKRNPERLPGWEDSP